LRRQQKRNYRKPLIIAAPKIGLKHPKAVSSLDDFGVGTTFKPILVNEYGNN
jgi:2-oxoglutarate dehydrogenase complex dehydrogenase (E1) component-like enzyme